MIGGCGDGEGGGGVGKGEGEFGKENRNDEEYPPLFQFDVVRDIGLCLAEQVERHLKITPIVPNTNCVFRIVIGKPIGDRR